MEETESHLAIEEGGMRNGDGDQSRSITVSGLWWKGSSPLLFKWSAKRGMETHGQLQKATPEHYASFKTVVSNSILPQPNPLWTQDNHTKGKNKEAERIR